MKKEIRDYSNRSCATCALMMNHGCDITNQIKGCVSKDGNVKFKDYWSSKLEDESDAIIHKNASESSVRDLVLSAIMKRYEGLAPLIGALREDSDVVYVNLEDDILQAGGSLSMDNIEKEVQLIIQ
jgi:hypothetical protein